MIKEEDYKEDSKDYESYVVLVDEADKSGMISDSLCSSVFHFRVFPFAFPIFSTLKNINCLLLGIFAANQMKIQTTRGMLVQYHGDGSVLLGRGYTVNLEIEVG